MPLFYAHSTAHPDKSDWQSLSEHLHNVAELAKSFGAAFDGKEWGYLAGLLHDAGKATKEFTARLEGKPKRVDHATFGAQLAQARAGRLGLLLSYAITGHHGGLMDGGAQENQLHFRLKHGKVADDTSLLQELDISSELKPPFLPEKEWAMFSFAFFTRMIFSCLVDADFLDTERFCTPEKAGRRKLLQNSDLLSLQKSLRMYLAEKERKAHPGKINPLRKSILAVCRTKAMTPQVFFSLTVPTGGGKTLSSLTFALDHAIVHNLNRVIYAIPFTSIIEQNAHVFSEAIGQENVLEHHCNYRDKDDESVYDKWRGLASENWDAPVVVTTNVQFFESLYSNKTSRCRKLHNIVGSVIVLDEAQAIPTEYLEPCLAALRELVAHYKCTVLLCTATQPAFADSSLLRSAFPEVTEIIDTPEDLYTQLKRVRIEFIGQIANDALAKQLSRQEQVLSIVSTKKQAQQVFAALLVKDGAFHLSTNMYPAHRTRVLKDIRQRLNDEQPCRVVSTSLVEAGVDLDFPVVYRAMAGLDSIAQAAGRCNREGKLEYGLVYVYEPEQLPAMPWLRRRVSRAREVLRLFPGEDCLGLGPMRRYFELLYDAEHLDKKEIVKRLKMQLGTDLIFPFREIAEDFRLIEDEGIGLIITGRKDDEEDTTRLIRELRNTEFPFSTIRKLQQYSVTVRTKTLAKLISDGSVEMIRERYPVLLNASVYEENLGLLIDMAEVWDPEALIQ
jgi:CRISPR-associated endonuclease/helicase Cas3